VREVCLLLALHLGAACSRPLWGRMVLLWVRLGRTSFWKQAGQLLFWTDAQIPACSNSFAISLPAGFRRERVHLFGFRHAVSYRCV
jgi:hypothetical protein